ncbi:MAG: hypothetical protein RR235_09030 [Oscillospiraceae bacterium]
MSMEYEVIIDDYIRFRSSDIGYLLDIVASLYRDGYSFKVKFRAYEKGVKVYDK